jgi:hypothetical protein
LALQQADEALKTPVLCVCASGLSTRVQRAGGALALLRSARGILRWRAAKLDSACKPQARVGQAAGPGGTVPSFWSLATWWLSRCPFLVDLSRSTVHTRHFGSERGPHPDPAAPLICQTGSSGLLRPRSPRWGARTRPHLPHRAPARAVGGGASRRSLVTQHTECTAHNLSSDLGPKSGLVLLLPNVERWDKATPSSGQKPSKLISLPL